MKPRVTVKAAHHYVADPEVNDTLDVWVRLLAESLRNHRPTSPVNEFGSVPARQHKQKRRPT